MYKDWSFTLTGCFLEENKVVLVFSSVCDLSWRLSQLVGTFLTKKKKVIIPSTIWKTYLQCDWQDEEVVYNFCACQGTGSLWSQNWNLAALFIPWTDAVPAAAIRSFIHSTHDSLEFMCPKDNLERRQDTLLYSVTFYKYSVRCWSFS